MNAVEIEIAEGKHENRESDHRGNDGGPVVDLGARHEIVEQHQNEQQPLQLGHAAGEAL